MGQIRRDQRRVLQEKRGLIRRGAPWSPRAPTFAGVSYAVLRAPLEVCLERVQDREGEPPVDAGAIERLWRSFADLGALERHVLEVDGVAPGRVSDELAERLSGGSLRA